MKKLSVSSLSLFLFLSLFLSVLPLVVSAYTSPGKPQGFVSDFANIIPPSERTVLEHKLSALQSSTGAEVAVVTVPSLGDETVESYAVALFQDWGIGKKGKDNGILILVAPTEHKVRIEVGYGLEGAITDLQSGNIINKVVTPAFKAGDYAKGIEGAVDAITAIITNSPEAAQYSEPASSNPFAGWHINFESALIMLFFAFNIGAAVLGRTKSWWLGGVIGAVIGIIIGFITASLVVGIVGAIVLTILGLIFDWFVSNRPPRGPGSGTGFWPIFFGPRGGGSSGGGFGGFGGGSSGGGGASGSW
jgi:uncharacterized protein